MNLGDWGKKTTTADIPDMAMPVVLSDEMIRRDNFFHSCWTKLKAERPDLCEDMAAIEVNLAGYTKIEEPEKKEGQDGIVL